MKNRSNFAQEKKYSRRMKNTLLYMAIFILWLVVANFVQFGGLVFILVSVMAGVAVVVAHICPSDAEGTLKSFKGTTAGFLLYVLLLFIVRLYLAKQGAVVGTFDTIYVITMVMTPVGYIGWQAKKVISLRGNGMSKRKALDYYKDHGNDGTM